MTLTLMFVPCAPAADTHGISTLKLGVEFVGRGNEKLAQDLYPDKVVLLFPPVRGAIYGNPVQYPLFRIETSGSDGLTLDFGGNEALLYAAATTLSTDHYAHDISVDPPQTRLFRMGTFAFDAQEAREFYGGGFVDPASRETMILIYVDRPCRFSGTMRSPDKETSVNIRFISAGMHWVHVRVVAPHKQMMEDVPDNSPAVFAIYPLEETSSGSEKAAWAAD